ncbi:MAG: plastocyanin/azurin family copper-binding protein [Acidimicrobiia bacterium]|nr:plastocyanin/azurin family copper-binding protein [Acidimicrobiia bacterium]
MAIPTDIGPQISAVGYPYFTRVGDTVRWTVNSGIHTTTSNTAVWDSRAMATGEVFTFTFDQAGSYPYICAIHPGMQASVTVEG